MNCAFRNQLCRHKSKTISQTITSSTMQTEQLPIPTSLSEEYLISRYYLCPSLSLLISFFRIYIAARCLVPYLAVVSSVSSSEWWQQGQSRAILTSLV
ncbi:hypothetical protein T4E_9619 [Trichinella pseudospiralis]|uniref:Uncharacterized protein n=1 Tax=Trichinella pseudospiralis TaxID=6337 RepID=A0A0V0XY91_TRIPS|nr:hypothetical protein T4E_9619 [Trichinella pseudospiralis]